MGVEAVSSDIAALRFPRALARFGIRHALYHKGCNTFVITNVLCTRERLLPSHRSLPKECFRRKLSVYES
jgi:hypothetical protein